MQLGEPVAIGVIASENHDSECYFCKANKEPTTEINDLKDDPDEDSAELDGSLGDYKFKNDAGKLGTALGGKPAAKSVRLGRNIYGAAVAAHHLIPGNASLDKSDLMDHLWVDGEA